MDVEREIERARHAEPPWDELRERRVLAQVMATRAGGAKPQGARRAAVAFGSIAAALALAAGIATVPRDLFGGESPRAVTAGIVQLPPKLRLEAPDLGMGRLALRDGSEVQLEGQARVEIVREEPTEVRLAQVFGRARYVVAHDPSRAFVIVVDDVEVRVRGTIFSVARSEPWVEVDVEDGVVEVARSAPARDAEVRTLLAGEALRVRLGETAPRRDDTDEPPAMPTIRTPRPHRSLMPAPVDEAAEVPSLDALLASADAARRAGRLEDAAHTLRLAVEAHSHDPRAATALFTLGRVERARGRDAAAAAAFERAHAADPRAVLAEDALAEAAVSWAAAGDASRAGAARGRYLQRYPSGEYAARVRSLGQ